LPLLSSTQIHPAAAPPPDLAELRLHPAEQRPFSLRSTRPATAALTSPEKTKARSLTSGSAAAAAAAAGKQAHYKHHPFPACIKFATSSAFVHVFCAKAFACAGRCCAHAAISV